MVGTDDATRNIRYHGRPEPPAAPLHLRAGPLTLLLDGADLRSIQLGGHEIIRRIYVAVRDPNWATIAPMYSQVRSERADDHFSVTFQAEHHGGDLDFAWQGSIEGGADGTICYSMDGVARSTFRTNRIGFCVLHPMDCAGRPFRVTHIDGSIEEGHFPDAIAPHQPFLDFEAIAHRVAEGVEAELRLAGEVFEMEDQRNWTDASFKTYGTPLRLPFPVEVAEGTRIRQSCTLRVRGAVPAARAPSDEAVRIAIDPTRGVPLPPIGLGMASHGWPLTAPETDWLRALRPAHLRVDLDLADAAYLRRLRQAVAEAAALDARLEVALFLGDDAERELANLAAGAGPVPLPVERWLVFRKAERATPSGWVALARRHLAPLAPGAGFGGGTDAYFAQLNRSRPSPDGLDLVCYSINPQVHAFDDASLVETPRAQASTLASARHLCGTLPLVVSPLTLRPRANPDATGPEPPPSPGALPPQVDPRQLSLLGAAWTVASLKHLALGGASALTLYETTGWRGVLERQAGSPLPERFPSHPGMLFPLYHVLADVAEHPGCLVLGTASSAPLVVEALALRSAGGTLLLLANLTATAQRVIIDLPDARGATVRSLDDRSYQTATEDGEAFRRAAGERHAIDGGRLALNLLPFAVARVALLA